MVTGHLLHDEIFSRNKVSPYVRCPAGHGRLASIRSTRPSRTGTPTSRPGSRNAGTNGSPPEGDAVHGYVKPTYAVEPDGVDIETRSYGLKIRYTTVAPGQIGWNGDQISYEKIKFTMNELRHMFDGLVDHTRSILAKLLFVKGHKETRKRPGAQPGRRRQRPGRGRRHPYNRPVPPDRLGQHPGRPQRRFVRLFVFKRRSKQMECRRQVMVTQSDVYRPRVTCQVGSGRPATIPASSRRRVWSLGRGIPEGIVGVEPYDQRNASARTEIISIRYHNTAHGSIRNVFIQDGLVFFITIYHKGYRKSGAVNLIYRYMPPCVGELLVWYLWLVLPFWQQVQGCIQKARETSPFVWSDNVVRPEDDREADEARTPGHSTEGTTSKAARHRRDTKRIGKRNSQWPMAFDVRQDAQSHTAAYRPVVGRAIRVGVMEADRRGHPESVFKEHGTG